MQVSTHMDKAMTPLERKELKSRQREENRLKNLERQDAGEYGRVKTGRKPI